VVKNNFEFAKNVGSRQASPQNTDIRVKNAFTLSNQNAERNINKNKNPKKTNTKRLHSAQVTCLRNKERVKGVLDWQRVRREWECARI